MNVSRIFHEAAAGRPQPALQTRPQDAAPHDPFEGYDRSYLDPSVRPQDDFYQYALGGYLKSHPIPPDRDSYGVREELNERIQDTLRDIVEKAAGDTQAAPGSIEQKIGDFYASGMDAAAIEAAGAKPLAPEFQRIDAIRSQQDVTDEIAHLHGSGLEALFGFGATQDAKNPSTVIGEAAQGGLGLPDRDYYLKQDPASQKIRDAYVDHVARMFVLLGDAPEKAKAAAATVMAIETKLAEASMSHVELRDPNATYHVMDRSQLATLTPHLSWDRYFAGLGRPDVDKINMATPSFFEKLDAHMAATPVDDWKTYLRWQLIDQTASSLSTPFQTENFNFYSKTLSGIESRPARWKQVLRATNAHLGFGLGQKFVERSFSPQAKARALDMVNHIKAELRDRIVHAGWMGEATRQEALAKIDSLVVKIGYPDKWEDYSGLHVDRGLFIDNVLRARKFDAARNLDTIGKPVDRSVWEMTPQTVNAYYHPLRNEIVFPAARLQPPFFDANADDATNYGATGVTMGHEMTHGFDDSGSQFDAQGHLRNWWQPDDLQRFKTLADGVEHQFDEFTYDGQKCNGKLVEGEALADQGGVELAYAALQRARRGKPSQPGADGFTPEQRFFLSYTLCREEAERPESAHLQMTTDPHPLGQFRVDGPLSNMPAFYEAFNVHPGDPMRRPEANRNKLWDA